MNLEGVPGVVETHESAEHASRFSPEEVANRIDALLEALPETIALLKESGEVEDLSVAAGQAEAARELAAGVRQEYANMRERIGEEVRNREEYKALEILAQFETLATALADAYGVVADMEQTAPADVQEHLHETVRGVMGALADIGVKETPST